MLISFLFLLALPIKSHASLLRGGTSNETLREAVQSLDDTFDCYPYQLDGHAEPGTDIEAEWSCEFEGTETEPVKTYFFEGNFENIMTERFGDDILEIAGVLKLIVPRSAVNESSIMIHHEGIDVSHDRRERRLARLTGDHLVLIVRVLDTYGHKPDHFISDLKSLFYQDENNLKKRLEACSNGKLKIKPASATGQNANEVEHGVINIKLKMDISSSSESWSTVGDKVSTALAQLQGINLSYTSRIFVMPNEVEFGGAAAWAQVGGNTIWVRDQYAGYPIVQVHEYGHLLGQRHSGKGSSGYGDNSCYMGNQIPWDNVGARMCFNAAKTYYFGWFSPWHKEVNPWSEPFSGFLVGIDDASKGRAQSSKVILKFSEGDKHYFIMFNRKKGINDQAIGGADQVMITEQNQRNYDSMHKSGLSPGEQIYIGSVVVKFCHIQYTSTGDRAKVMVYRQGQSMECRAPPGNGNGNAGGNGNGNRSCVNGNSWHDGGGAKYTCAWYTLNPNACDLFGHKHPREDGRTANDVCCACKNR